MTEEEYQQFRHEAVHALMDLNEAVEREFRLSALPRWDYDLSDGVLVFSAEDVAKVIADIQVVGTTSNESKTWMWGWANDSLPPRAVSRIDAVRKYGDSESIPQLTTDVLTNDDYLGWELTAVTARLLGAKGAYRCPGDNGFLYVVYEDIRFAQEGESTRTIPSEEASMIECGMHGAARSTYICDHLLADPEQAWFSEDPTDDDPWPDAWCAQCDLIFQEQGEWNDSNCGKVPIKHLCHHCYEVARSKEVQ
ncbi:MAG: hypothetical protein J0L64_26235 [Acidobacteria bacterium]|nr:hypothetical protein [Acidobacteriota bacterium]